MKSPTYGEVDFTRVVHIIAEYIQTHGTDRKYELCVGTDSQNFDYTKMVMVITMHDVGHGGIFFYDVLKMRRISNVREKLTVETTKSLEYAEKLLLEVENYKEETGFDITEHVSICIHVDAGPNGKSREVISEISGWIHSCGYEVRTKPDSYAASAVANKISK